MKTTFVQRLLRLKLQLKVTKDKQVAEALGLSEKAFAIRKCRNAFPEKDLRVLAQQRPELGLDVAYILGDESTAAADAPATDAQPTDPAAAQLHAHTLNRVVPAMADGFTIATTYGDLAIEPGPLAERMRDLVALYAQLELVRLQGRATGEEVRP